MRSACALVYVTCDKRVNAMRMAGRLVADGLAACANIWGPIDSIYEWDGKMQNGREFVLVMKTARKRVTALTKAVKALHSYECPCIVALDIASGHDLFLRWIAAQTDRRVGASRRAGSRSGRHGKGSKAASTRP